MANETTHPRQSTAPSVPERVLRIDGERTAAMYSLAIRVSRLDQRLRDLAGVATLEGRKQYRQATEGFQKHIAQFEDGLAEVEKDAEVNSRRGGRPNSNAQRRGAPQRQQQSGAAAISGGPASAPQQPSKPAEAKPASVTPTLQMDTPAPAAASAAPAPAQPQKQQKQQKQQNPQQNPQQKQQQKPEQKSQQPKSGQANGQAKPAGNKQNNGGKGKGPMKSGATPQQQKTQQPQAVATVTL